MAVAHGMDGLLSISLTQKLTGNGMTSAAESISACLCVLVSAHTYLGKVDR